jgi:hypothetical protein
MKTIDKLYFVPVKVPVADAFAGTLNTDIVKALGEAVMFEITKGVGTTGTSVITVDACDDVSPSNTTAVVFWYKTSTTLGVWSDWTAATVAGFTLTAGSNQQYLIYVPADVLAAADQYGYVRLTATESVNDPVLGGVNAIVVNTSYAPQLTTLLT